MTTLKNVVKRVFNSWQLYALVSSVLFFGMVFMAIQVTNGKINANGGSVDLGIISLTLLTCAFVVNSVNALCRYALTHVETNVIPTAEEPKEVPPLWAPVVDVHWDAPGDLGK